MMIEFSDRNPVLWLFLTPVMSHPDLTVISLLSGRHGDSGYWPSDNNLIDMSSLNGEISLNAQWKFDSRCVKNTQIKLIY